MTMALSIIQHPDNKHRCSWCGQGEAFADYIHYHDHEWGMPVVDERRLFEKITLEGFQAGLSWITILRKRDRFREAFKQFDYEKVARFTEKDVDALVQDAGIIRHRGKIESAINNAQKVCDLIDAQGAGALAKLIWSHEPTAKQRPAKITPEQNLAQNGFQLRGPHDHVRLDAIHGCGQRSFGRLHASRTGRSSAKNVAKAMSAWYALSSRFLQRRISTSQPSFAQLIKFALYSWFAI
jgi:DNA-3-methyladenine glycosylase I